MQTDIQQPEPEGGRGFSRALRRAGALNLNIELLGEVILLVIIGGFFIYIFVDSMGWLGGRKWPFSSTLGPWIFVAMGIPLLFLRLAQLMKLGAFKRPSTGDADIMDIGFRVGGDRLAAQRRFAGIITAIALFFLAIWFLGVYVAVPLWVFGYMLLIGRSRLYTAALMAALLLGLILVYDWMLFPRWHDPLLLTLWRSLVG